MRLSIEIDKMMNEIEIEDKEIDKGLICGEFGDDLNKIFEE